MQQVEMRLEGTLLDMMYVKPWDTTSFRLGEHWGALNRRAYLAAKAAHKNQRNNISNNTPPHLPSGRTSSDLAKTNRMVADTQALRSPGPCMVGSDYMSALY